MEAAAKQARTIHCGTEYWRTLSVDGGIIKIDKRFFDIQFPFSRFVGNPSRPQNDVPVYPEPDVVSRVKNRTTGASSPFQARSQSD
jgi:hypothetical protein